MDVLAVKQACRFAKEYVLKNGPIVSFSLCLSWWCWDLLWLCFLQLLLHARLCMPCSPNLICFRLNLFINTKLWLLDWFLLITLNSTWWFLFLFFEVVFYRFSIIFVVCKYWCLQLIIAYKNLYINLFSLFLSWETGNILSAFYFLLCVVCILKSFYLFFIFRSLRWTLIGIMDTPCLILEALTEPVMRYLE